MEGGQHQAQRGCIGWDAERLAGCEDEFYCLMPWLGGFDQSEAHRLSSEDPSPCVEGMFGEVLIAAKCADTLAAGSLLGDSLAP